MTTPMNPDELWSIAQLGHTYIEHERFDEAQKIFAGLTTLAPQMGYPWHALGIIARRRGNLERAVGCLERAHQLDPGDLDVQLSLGEALTLRGAYAEARALLAAVVQRSDDPAMVARARAMMRT